MGLASAKWSASRMKRSSRPARRDGRQHEKPDEAETVQAPQSTPDQAATHIQHVPLTTAQAAIFRSPDLWAARHSLETRLRQLQHVQCALTSNIADSSQPLSVNGLTVEVQKQDLTEIYVQDVCAIVHPTNTWLGTQGGVSTAIAAALGHQVFQESCSRLLVCNSGSIGWGEAKISSFPITATNHLFAQYVIHAVLPLYSGDAAKDGASMQSMVQAVLDAAAQAGVTTLAMPLLGAGLAQWPVVPTAKAHVAKVLAAAYCRPGGTRLKKVIFADLNDEAVAALRAELARQAPQFSLSLSGSRAGCQAAAQHLGRTLEARKQKVRVDTFFDLSDAQQESVLEMPAMEYLTVDEEQQYRGFFALQGDAQLVSKVQFRIEALLAAKVPYVVDCPINSFPSHWAAQQSNTELFEVDLKSPEVAEVMATLRRQCTSVQTVKVHRIQNKKLWKHFAFHYSNMQERWSHEPGLKLVNGGRPQLWHGTSATEPQRVYATEQGFAFNFARKDSIWGSGTYYSCNPSLALNYCHMLQPNDTAFSTHLAGMQGLSGLQQIMAVDVLTGKSKLLVADDTLCTPPKIEDESVGIQLGISELRYDSVTAMHPHSDTPIYITYNSGHGYPKYLITYTT